MTNYQIITNEHPTPEELLTLFDQTSWAKNRDKDSIQLLIENTQVFVVIRADDNVIGYGRAISDGVYRALLDDLVVDESYRNLGIGKIIVKNLMEQLNRVEQIFLNTKPSLEGFYNGFGFEASKCLTMNL